MRSVIGLGAVSGDAQACLDHSLVLGEQHLYPVIRDAKRVAYFNRARPHQGIEQKVPEASTAVPAKPGKGKLIAFRVLKGLHHDYPLAA